MQSSNWTLGAEKDATDDATVLSLFASLSLFDSVNQSEAESQMRALKYWWLKVDGGGGQNAERLLGDIYRWHQK